jgi:sugar O-acyltransferase (sialic acid O-acetyltransferase NeuD family)
MTRLAVLGASGHARVVADAALAAGWREVVLFDDRWPELASVGPWRVVGDAARLLGSHAEYDGVIVAIGANRVRLARHRALVGAGARMATINHPSAVVSRFAQVGAGSVLCAGAVLNPFAVAGAAVIINTGATVDHDCTLADGVHVSPGAHLGGTVRVGEATWIGIGAAVRQGIVIGTDVVVGAGAAVVSDIADSLTIAGVPARTLNLDART